MLPAFVLDTSVIIKWFRQEEILAAQALELRNSYLEGRIAIAIPSLLAYELANVLRYKADLSTSQVEEAVQSLFDLGLNWVLPSAEICVWQYPLPGNMKLRSMMQLLLPWLNCSKQLL